jgi:hypothetical protein
MRRISPIKAAVALGAVTGLWHLMWVTLVGLGSAKPILDFVLRLHFIKVDYALAPYAATTAGALVILGFVIGALFGLLFAIIWNWLTIETAPEWARDSKPSSSTQLAD